MENGDEPIRHPRITKAFAKALIVKEKIIIDTEMQVVICIVKLKNGHRLIDHAIVANRGTFDPARGTVIAKAKVIEQIMSAEMYQLRTKLHEQKLKEVGDAD
jgi:hypothetical protein